MRSPASLATSALVAALLVSIAASPARAGFTLVRSYDGLVPGAEFGFSCVVIGDMDGDGIVDFAIGAPGDDTGGSDAGRVFIYRGGHPLDDEPAWVITGAPGDRLGQSLAVGYVDGDLRPDLVIGAPGGLGAPGRIAIAYGGSPLGSRSLANIPAVTPAGRFGWSVQGIGSLGPSPLRILVGAPDANDGAGEVTGLAGGDPPPAPPVFVLHGQTAGEHFGYSLADAGITRGFIVGPEFLVGAPDAAGNGEGSGRFALYLYDAVDDTVPDFAVVGSVGAHLGRSMTGGVDINSNFFEPSDDFIIGAPDADPHGVLDAGSSLVFVGGPQYAYDGNHSQSTFGTSVRLMHEIAGSNLPDLAVGELGAVRVFTGPLNPDDSPAASLFGEESLDGFGAAISNDGHIDPSYPNRGQFLVGAPQHAGTGRVYIYTDLSVPTGVGPSGLPAVLSFSAPSPNPSGGTFSMSVEMPRPSTARLSVLDVTGRHVATLHKGPLGAGRFAFSWTPRGADAAGIYWGVLETDEARIVRRMVRVR